MSVKYTYSISNDFPNSIVNSDRLSSEIRSSDITIALDYINTYMNDCDIWFKADLTSPDQTVLSGVISAHGGAVPDVITPPTMDDGRPIVRADTRPLDTQTYFTMAGDTASGIGNGVELRWDFSDPENYPTSSGTLSCGHQVPEGYKAIVVDLTFMDPVFPKDGAIYFFDAPWGCRCDMCITAPLGSYYPNIHGSIPASALGLPGTQMYSYAATDTNIAKYINRQFIYGTCPMGDELNAEGCTVDGIPVGWIIRGIITTPNSDNVSKGFASFEMYRHRTVLLTGDTP